MKQVRATRKINTLPLALFLLFACPAQSHAQDTAPKRAELTAGKIYRDGIFFSPELIEVKWAPDASRVSYYRFTGEGRELMLEEISTGKERVLLSAAGLSQVLFPEKEKHTQATGLGRAAPESYQWAPDSGALLFAGGGHLVLLDLKTMAPRHLLDTDANLEDVKFSPDARWVSYVRDANLWVASAATGETRALTTGGSEEILKGKLDWVYPEELDNRTAYWWSPDSKRVAYFEMDERPVTRYPIIQYDSPTSAIEMTRYPLAGEANPILRVGVVNVEGGETAWMDTGKNPDVYIPRVAWLPDAKSLAIERLDRSQKHLDFLLADVASGSSAVLFSEDDKNWINIADDLRFLDSGRRILWSSERAGYRHLYLYDENGRLMEQLTSGNWPVTKVVGVDEKNGAIYFLSNKDNPVESQLYRFSLTSKSIARITKERGWHEIEMAPDSSAYLDTFSTATTPKRQEICRADGGRITLLTDGKIPALADYQLSAPEFVTVPAGGGTELEAEMIRPPDFDAKKKYPALIYVYGGPGFQQVRDAWDRTEFLFSELMAQRGYIVFSLDNRGSSGRGHVFETPIARHLGKVELADQLAGVHYLKSLAYVDGSRIGIWGWSYGGTMALEALFHASDVFKAGAAVAPVTDWSFYDSIYTERYMGRPQDNPDGYRDSSPANFAANLKGRLLVIHGTGDDNVHFVNTAKLLNNMIDAGEYPEVVIFPGRGHSITDSPALYQVFAHIEEFFLRNL